MLPGKYYGGVVCLSCQPAPKSIVQIQQQHLFGNPPLKPDDMEEQLHNALLGLIGVENAPHVPHFKGKGIFRAHFLYYMTIRQNADIRALGAKGPETFLPPVFQRAPTVVSPQDFRFRSPQESIGNIIQPFCVQSRFQ